jgi:hypothetical protein
MKSKKGRRFWSCIFAGRIYGRRTNHCAGFGHGCSEQPAIQYVSVVFKGGRGTVTDSLGITLASTLPVKLIHDPDHLCGI